MRSILTMLGIIGVAAVIAMVSVGRKATRCQKQTRRHDPGW
jgi:hypothetical protein